MTYDPSLFRASLKRVVTNDVQKKPPLTKRKFVDQIRNKNKDKAPVAPTSLSLRPLVIFLDAVQNPIETMTQIGVSSSVPIYRPDWPVPRKDLCHI